MKKIGVIGLGDMGSGIALNLIKNGFKVFGSDLLPARQEAFEKMGGSLETSISSIGKKCDAVFVMVMNGSEAKSIIFDEDGLAKNMEKGSTIILSATIKPSEAEEIGQLIKDTGVKFIDTPVSGGFPGAQSGKLTLMASASESVQTDDLRDNLVALFESGLDAIVFVGGDGTILSMNDAFLRLADIAHASTVRSKSIAEFLNRGTVDLNVILENAKRSGAMRLYATKIKSDLGADRAIEISTTRLSAGADAVYALMIRDASRLDANRSTNLQVSDVDMESVIEYIGNQSLKDIVATTTDVVEKMCIETAVKMTSNNRVAAAEMLGLSRQSLYVKLRKYGLVKRD